MFLLFFRIIWDSGFLSFFFSFSSLFLFSPISSFPFVIYFSYPPFQNLFLTPLSFDLPSSIFSSLPSQSFPLVLLPSFSLFQSHYLLPQLALLILPSLPSLPSPLPRLFFPSLPSPLPLLFFPLTIPPFHLPSLHHPFLSSPSFRGVMHAAVSFPAAPSSSVERGVRASRAASTGGVDGRIRGAPVDPGG